MNTQVDIPETDVLRHEINEAIEQSGDTQRIYARRAQINQGNLSQFLSGKRAAPTREVIQKIAAAAPDGCALKERFKAGLTPKDTSVAKGALKPELVLLRQDQLVPDPNNARKVFDKEALDSLAKSISQVGVNNPLLARSIGNGKYQLIGGERRWRAIEQLIKTKQWDGKAANVPVSVKPGDVKDADLIAIIDNVQRVDISKVEFAHGVRRLRTEHGMSAADIAAQLGYKKRTIEQSLNLLEKLDPNLIRRVEKKTLTFEQARKLWPLPVQLQAPVLEHAEAEAELYGDPLNIDSAVSDQLCNYPSQWGAVFELQKYTGETVNGHNGAIHFFDVEQFETLQQEAIKRTVADLEQRWSSVQQVKEFPYWNYSKTKKKADGQAFLEVNTVKQGDHSWTTVKVYAGYKKPDSAKSKPSKSKPDTEESGLPTLTQTQMVLAHAVRSRHLQKRMTEASLNVAHAAFCVGMLSSSQYGCAVKIGATSRHHQDLTYPQSTIWEALGELLSPLSEAKLIEWEVGDARFLPTLNEENQAAAFRLLVQLPTLSDIVAHLIAIQTGCWPGYTISIGSDGLAAAIAEEVDADLHGHFKLEETYLKACSKPVLRAIAASAIDQGKSALDDMPEKRSDAAAWILNHPDLKPDWIPPEYNFGTVDQNQEAFLEMLKGEAA